MSFEISTYPYDRLLPARFQCPITLDVMEDPVRVDCEGIHAFENREITKHMGRSLTCALDGSPITKTTPDGNLKAEITTWKSQHRVEEIVPEQLASYFVSPNAIPVSTSSDQLQTLSAYLRFIKATKKIDKVASCLARWVHEHNITIPSCNRKCCPKVFDSLDAETYVIFSDIVSNAHQLNKDPNSQNYTNMIEEMKQSNLHHYQAHENFKENMENFKATITDITYEQSHKIIRLEADKIKKEEKIEELETQLDQTNQQLDQTNQQLDQTNQQLDQTNQQLGQTNHQLEQANNRISVMENINLAATIVGIATAGITIYNPVTFPVTGYLIWKTPADLIDWSATFCSAAQKGSTAAVSIYTAGKALFHFRKPSAENAGANQ